MNGYPSEYQRNFNGINLMPFGTFLSFCLIANPLLLYVIENSLLGGMNPNTRFLISVFFTGVSGWAFGQVVVLNVIGGLGGRHWVNGFMLAIALGTIGVSLIVLCNIRPEWSASVISSFWCMPAAILIASIPFTSMRLIRRWRISDSDQLPAPIRIEDYFIMMAVLGSSIALCRAHYVIGMTETGAGGAEFGFMWLTFGGQLFLINLFSIPAIGIAFLPVPFVIRVVYLAVYSLVVCIGITVLLTILVALSGGGNSGGMSELLLFVLGAVVMTSLVVNVGIQCLRMSGFWMWSKRADQPRRASSGVTSQPVVKIKFAKQVPDGEQAIDPFSDEAESMAEARATRRTSRLDGSQQLARWLTVGLVLLALLANLIAVAYSIGNETKYFEDYPAEVYPTPAE